MSITIWELNSRLPLYALNNNWTFSVSKKQNFYHLPTLVMSETERTLAPTHDPFLISYIGRLAPENLYS